MSFFSAENYWPFDSGAGSAASSSRWELLASALLPNGVIENRYNQFNPTLASGVLTIDTGAGWINGTYFENLSTHTLAVTSDGLIVIRLDQVNQIVTFQQITGLIPSNTATLIDLPLAAMVGGVLQDWRQFTGPQRPRPGTIEFVLCPPSALPGALPLTGQILNRQQYSRLFLSPIVQGGLGTAFGVGDGSSTFQLPDGRGYTLAGLDNMGGSAAGKLASLTALGAVVGASTAAIALANLAAHTHPTSDPQHTHTLHDAGHNHPLNDAGHEHNGATDGQVFVTGPNVPNRGANANYHLVGDGGSTALAGNFEFTATTNPATTGATITNQATGVTLQSAPTGVTSASAGGGTPLPIVQPTLGLNLIIWT